MKIPKVIKAVGRSYQVHVEESKDFTGELNGEVNVDKQVIRIASGQGFEGERETLLHEVIHIVEKLFAVDLEEEQVKVLSNALFNVLRDNPKFVSYLLEEQ